MADIDIKALVGRLNQTCTRALEGAAGSCVSRTNYEVSVEHVLNQLLQDSNADVIWIFKQFGVDPAKFQKGLLAAIEECRTGNSGRPVFSPIMMEWLQQGWLQASLGFDLTEIRSGVLLYTVLTNPARYCAGDYQDMLQEFPRPELKAQFFTITKKSSEASPAREALKAEKAGARTGEGALARFCVDFTGRAREGLIDPVFGRDREIRQMVILSLLPQCFSFPYFFYCPLNRRNLFLNLFNSIG